MNTPIQLIVGLGNPGAQYAHSRHNAGADFVAQLAQQYDVKLVANSKWFGISGQTLINHQTIGLFIPTTFMNASGKAVAAIANFYKIAPASILVAHDELDIPSGEARLKIGGGHGGHNGLRDIIKCLGNNNNFARLRIGINHPGDAKLVSSYVLKKAPTTEFQQIEDSIDNATKVMPLIVDGKWNEAMKQLHTKGSGKMT